MMLGLVERSVLSLGGAFVLAKHAKRIGFQILGVYI